MKAVKYQRYGGPEVLEMVELPLPSVGNKEVLVQVHATTITSGDRQARSLALPRGYGLFGRLMFGLFRPRHPILGTEFAGVVVEVGASVTDFSLGDRVFAYPGGSFGGYAEYAVMAEGAAIAKIPDSVTFAQAAAMSFGGCTALTFLRDLGRIRLGDKVLVQGATGGVGSACVQIARYFGARVTAVCRRENTDMVKTLGAHRVLGDPRQGIGESSEGYDIIIDTSGSMSYSQAEPWLNAGGRLLLVAANLPQAMAMYTTPKREGKKGFVGYSGELVSDMKLLANLVNQKQYKPWIDRQYSFSELTEAHADYEREGKRGNWVVNIVASR